MDDDRAGAGQARVRQGRWACEDEEGIQGGQAGTGPAPTTDMEVEPTRAWLKLTVESLLKYPGDPDLTERAERACWAPEEIQTQAPKWAAEEMIDSPGEGDRPDRNSGFARKLRAAGSYLGYKKGYTRLIERLKDDDTIERFERTSHSKFKVWLKDRGNTKGHYVTSLKREKCRIS